jgi:uncharacterized membrane protein
MRERLQIPAGIAIGAGVMYLLDPERGKRRRARMRDRMNSSWHKTNYLLATARRDADHRVQGFIAETRALMSPGPVSDDVLVQRVRAKLGRYSSHPRALEISAENGKVTISGPILKSEVDTVLSVIENVPGVSEVEPSLEVHESAENISALQGGVERPGERPDFMQENWAPATRVAGTIAGGTMAIAGMRRRGVIGLGLAASGLALLARSITNLELRQMIGLSPPEEGIEVHKSININAPVEEVYKLWTNLENYPKFMQHVREIRKTDTGQYHWVVDGPGGTHVAWDAVVTEQVPNDKFAWKTVPGAQIPQTGYTRFIENPDGTTRIDVHMTYTPPGGLIGHAVASIFGMDPRHQMDDDLVRFQSLIERGKTTAKGREVTRDELAVADVSPAEDTEEAGSPPSEEG